jgi:hypothetical protein
MQVLEVMPHAEMATGLSGFSARINWDILLFS